MDANNPFDNALSHIPDDIKDLAVFVVDTLDLCWKGAKAVFGDQAKPEHAFEIYDRLMSRYDAQSTNPPLQEVNYKADQLSS